LGGVVGTVAAGGSIGGGLFALFFEQSASVSLETIEAIAH
jgi:hypothetical protein